MNKLCSVHSWLLALTCLHGYQGMAASHHTLLRAHHHLCLCVVSIYHFIFEKSAVQPQICQLSIERHVDGDT